MSAASDSKRSNRRAKKKRAAQHCKENQGQKDNSASMKTLSFSGKATLNEPIALSQVVNKSSFTPFLDGGRCILCHRERPTISSLAGKVNDDRDGLFDVQQFVDKVPLWVCQDCRKRVEEDEHKAGLDAASHLLSSEVVANSMVSENGANKDSCDCHVCAGKRYLVPAKSKEIGELQFSWFEVKHFVRCIYRKAGTTLADEDTLSKTSLDMHQMKTHTDKLTKRDAYQLYKRLEIQAREYLSEVRVSLIKFFSSTFSNSLQHAKDCVMTLLDEYKSLCVATDILRPFFEKLDNDLLVNHHWSWELMNKEAFKEEVFNDSVIRVNLPLFFEQLVRGETSASLCNVPDGNNESELIKSFEAFTWEVADIIDLWWTAKPLLEKYERENNSYERGEYENWDEPIKTVKPEDTCSNCTCKQCSLLTSSSNISDTLLSLKRPLSSSVSSAIHHGDNVCWPGHAQDCCDDGSDSMQLLPTAMFLDRLSNSKCASCIREALHSFCFGQNTMSTPCEHYVDNDKSSPSLKVPSCPTASQGRHNHCHTVNHSSHDAFWYNNDVPPPETASSIQSLLGGSGGTHCQKYACCAQWNHEDKGVHQGHCAPPSITIPGNDEQVEAPPSSPSSDRSVGDGSSCDTPTSPSSLSDDGKSNNGKYCDCCYCEFFGHGNPPVAPTSHNFVEMREKLRLRLKEKERKAAHFSEHGKGLSCLTDTRSLDQLLMYINGDEDGNIPNKTASKAAKRQRQKQKKAAEKGLVSPNDTCLSRTNGAIDEKPMTFLEEKSKKNSKQKKSTTGKENLKLQENLTKKENVKNHEMSENIQTHDEAGNIRNEKLKTDKRKKKTAPCNTVCNKEETGVLVNGSEHKSSPLVEHTQAPRHPTGEEAGVKHFDEEVPAPETQTDDQKKKAKNRKKKKGKCLDDAFLPKESYTNGHNGEVDEAEREIEEFKRFCASVAPVTRKLKLPANVNLKNLNLAMKKS